MKVGVLGCMAERLKSQFLEEEKIVDLVVGPIIKIFLTY
jgi:tRNA-2-methylthio-N6-dimethylallyladenosine synthase